MTIRSAAGTTPMTTIAAPEIAQLQGWGTARPVQTSRDGPGAAPSVS
ncbi:hypothetical protein [Kribbella yunnanensis]